MAAATADFILSGLALSGSVVLGNRNFYRCGMGQRVLGKLLGLGPERSLGFDLLFNLWCGIPRTIACRLPATPVLPCLYGVGFPYGADDLLRSKLSAGRYA